MSVFTTGNVKAVAINLDGLVMPDDVNNPDLCLQTLELARSSEDYSHFCSGSTATHHTQINTDGEVNITIHFKTSSPAVSYEKLRATEGDLKPAYMSIDDVTLTPSVNSPLRGFYASVPPWPGEGGEVGSAWEVDHTFFVDGAVEYLEAPLAVPQNVAAGSPTSTTIDVSWDADTDTLECDDSKLVIKGYDVYQGLAPGGPYVKVNPALVTNTGTGTITFQDTALTPSTAYYYVVRGVWQFGLETDDSAEVTATTTA
jgi:hypothetical protein